MSDKGVQDALMELCRRGILEMGLKKGEPTYRLTREFGETLKECNHAILLAGGYDMDPPAMLAALALVNWCGSLEEGEAYRLTNVLTGVLRSYAV